MCRMSMDQDLRARVAWAVCHSGIGAGCSSVYTPCWISMPISVAVTLFPIDQLSSGVVVVMPLAVPLADDAPLR